MLHSAVLGSCTDHLVTMTTINLIFNPCWHGVIIYSKYYTTNWLLHYTSRQVSKCKIYCILHKFAWLLWLLTIWFWANTDLTPLDLDVNITKCYTAPSKQELSISCKDFSRFTQIWMWSSRLLTTWFWAHTDTTPLDTDAMIGLTGCQTTSNRSSPLVPCKILTRLPYFFSQM